MKSNKIISFLTLFLILSCSEDNSDTKALNDIELEEQIIGTWQLYNLEILDKNKLKLELPEYLSIECESETKYTFLENKEFIIDNSTSWSQQYNDQNEFTNFICAENNEGGGFDKGNWYVDFNQNGEKSLDLNWVYKSSAEDGALWIPEFISKNTFSMTDFDEYKEWYYLSYYERVE